MFHPVTRLWQSGKTTAGVYVVTSARATSRAAGEAAAQLVVAYPFAMIGDDFQVPLQHDGDLDGRGAGLGARAIVDASRLSCSPGKGKASIPEDTPG
ncbi:MAG: hypothetical protein E6J79_18010 [Deltaproteobacteria bacterium]|nr:MAG: hypothetical protein E6J79_18010 [Deltaproteobacteria bacterium]